MGNKPIPAKLERAPLEEVKKPKFFDKMMRFFEFVFTIANYLGRFSRKYKVGEAVKDFMHHNKDLLIIVCDPQNDTIMTGYKDYMTGTVMKPQPGKKRAKVIKGVMGLSRQEENIDRFLLQIDGAVFNIAKAIRDGRRDGNGKTNGVGPVKVINNQIANA
jgi:hypothetical protein